LLVAALTNEAATAHVQVWLSQQDPEALLVSEWVATEFASALSIKIRTGALTVEERARVAGAFTRLKLESLTVVPVTREHFLTAARFAAQHGIGLRAGDALHVAVAAGHGATICTLDKRLADGAIALGVSAWMV
jgi:uncharacterized protein